MNMYVFTEISDGTTYTVRAFGDALAWITLARYIRKIDRHLDPSISNKELVGNLKEQFEINTPRAELDERML